MGTTTRPIIWRTLCSRCGLPGTVKYLETTTLVADQDEALGYLMLACSKTTLPFSLIMDAERCSHSISSYGLLPLSHRVKWRYL